MLWPTRFCAVSTRFGAQNARSRELHRNDATSLIDWLSYLMKWYSQSKLLACETLLLVSCKVNVCEKWLMELPRANNHKEMDGDLTQI